MSVQDYTPRQDGRWPCLHKAADCQLGRCQRKNHLCCIEGHDEEGLKRAIKKAESTWRGQVERMIKNGELDRKHMTWPKKESKSKKAAGEEPTAIEPAGRVKSPEPFSQPAVTTNPSLSARDRPSVAPKHAATLPPPSKHATKTNEAGCHMGNHEIDRLEEHLKRKREQYSHRQHPDLEYFELWANAKRAKVRGLLLTDEHKVWLWRPDPHSLRDAPFDWKSLGDGPFEWREIKVAPVDTRKDHEVSQHQRSEGHEAAAMPCETADANQKLDTAISGAPSAQERELSDDEIDSLFEDTVSPQVAS